MDCLVIATAYLLPCTCLDVKLVSFIALMSDFFEPTKQKDLVHMQVETVTTPRMWDLSLLFDLVPLSSRDVKAPHIVERDIVLS